MDVKALSKIFGPTIVGYSGGIQTYRWNRCALRLEKQIQETYQQLLYSSIRPNSQNVSKCCFVSNI